MMKSRFRLSVVCLFFLSSAAFAQQDSAQVQTKNRVFVGGGLADQGGYSGYNLFIEYNRSLGKRFGVGLSLRRTPINTQQENEHTLPLLFWSKSSALDISAFYTPIRYKSHELRLGAGFTLARYEMYFYRNFGTNSISAYMKPNQISTHLLLSATYQYRINKRWSVGVRGGWHLIDKDYGNTATLNALFGYSF